MGLRLLGAFPPPSSRQAGPHVHVISAPLCTAMSCREIPEGSNDFKCGHYKDHDVKYCNKEALSWKDPCGAQRRVTFPENNWRQKRWFLCHLRWLLFCTKVADPVESLMLLTRLRVPEQGGDSLCGILPFPS